MLFNIVKETKMELNNGKGETRMSQTVTKIRRKDTLDARFRRKDEILGILARSAEEEDFIAQFSGNQVEAPSDYYTMTSEELTALAAGDIDKIGTWVGKLDSKQATWLMARLCQTQW